MGGFFCSVVCVPWTTFTNYNFTAMVVCLTDHFANKLEFNVLQNYEKLVVLESGCKAVIVVGEDTRSRSTVVCDETLCVRTRRNGLNFS